ncbi:protein involved in gliding motility EpsB [Flavobacteriaceae bacterium MAR_2009_75]|nr:protein involved in gliding motility EpsB [Flavobacteriaceae bacterium MAR_2009_75]
MNDNSGKILDGQNEVDLKSFFRRIYKNKYLFLISVIGCVVLAIIYIKLATPVYEVSTSLLIDSKGRNRVLGESEYVEGGVGLIEIEKNLYNEIGIIKSYSLIKQTVEDLDFHISYFAKSGFKNQEQYGYFPFEVVLNDSSAQIYGVPFEVKVISENKYKLFIDADDFVVANPVNGTTRQIEQELNFSKEYSFGDSVNNNFFSFIIKRSSYEVPVNSYSDSELSFTIRDIDDVANEYLGKVDVNNIDVQASIFKIVSEGANVAKEKAFLEKLTENYIHNELGSRNKIASGKEEFIRDQLHGISDSLSKFEVRLEEFKKDKKAVNLSATATNALGQTNDLQMQSAKLKMDIGYYNAVINSVENNRNSDEFIMPSGIGIEDPLINQNILALKQLYDERSKKKFFVTSNNQEMTILNKQVQGATEVLLNNLRSAVQSSRIALGGLNSRMSSIDSQISTLPTTEFELLNIQRQRTLYENLFNYLSQELAKTGIARAENTSDTRVLDEARMEGTEPIKPQKTLLFALAIILGLLLPMVKIILWPSEAVIENINQILANSEMPVIANIVHYDSKSKGSKLAKSISNGNADKVFGTYSEIALWKQKESFRELGANLKLINSSGKGVIGITSILPEEGKTYNAINLGITLAEAGKKTIIVDTDLRNPSLVERLNEAETKGLSNYLTGEIDNYKNIVYSHKKVSNLKFIPTSVLQGNVHELLSSDKMTGLLDSLKHEYDYVILDTPAVGLVSDFLLLLDSMDINLFVVRRNISKVNFLEDLDQLIPSEKKKKSYIIFNGALKKGNRYGYRSKYGVNQEEQLVDEKLSV